MRRPRCVRWVCRYRWRLLGVVFAAVAVWVVWSTLAYGLEQRHKKAAARAERVYICEQINERAIAPLHGLLEQAQSTSARNPIPPGLTEEQRAFVEAQRAAAAELYRTWLGQTEPFDCGQTP